MDQGFINLFYVFGGIIAFVLFIVIMRAVFSIPTLVVTSVNNMKC